MKKREIIKIEKGVSNSLLVEGKKPSTFGKTTTRKFLNGDIDSKTAIKNIKEKYLKLLVLPLLTFNDNMSYIKINPNFGTDFYNSIKSLLFFGAVIAVIIALIKTLTQEKIKIVYLLGQVLISALILFIVYNPLNMLHMGEFLYNFMFSVVKDLELKEAGKCYIHGWIN